MSEYEAMLDGIEFGAERSWDYALDAAHDALDATAEKFGVKTDAGIMREFHAAIEALREEKK